MRRIGLDVEDSDTSDATDGIGDSRNHVAALSFADVGDAFDEHGSYCNGVGSHFLRTLTGT